MKFNGQYEVTRDVNALDLHIKDSMIVPGNINLEGKLHAGVTDDSEINLGSTKATCTYEADNDNAIANQKVTKNLLTTSHFSTVKPKDTDGKDNDLYFEGIIKEQAGGLNIIPNKLPEQLPYHIASNGSDAIITCTCGANMSGTLWIWRTSNGIDWDLHDTQLPPAGGNYSIVATDAGFTIIPDKFSSGAQNAYFSDTLGTSWVKLNVPSDINNAGMFYNPPAVHKNVIIISNVDGKLPMMRSVDGGKTFTSVKLPSSVSGYVRTTAVYNNYAYAITTTGQIFRSTNSGATWSLVGTHSALVESSVGVTALDSMRLAIWSRDSMYISTNGGSNVTFKTRFTGHYIYSIHANHTNSTALISTKAGSTSRAYITDSYLNNRKEIPYTSDGNQYTSGIRASTSHSDMYIRFGTANNKGVFQYIPADQSRVNDTVPPIKPSINNMYVKYNGKWKHYNPDVSDIMDERYLLIAGGTVGALELTGAIDLQSNKILNVPTPTDNTDAVNLQYVENAIKSAASTDKDVVLSTSNTDIDTIAKDVETVKYVISAKKDTKRYYSQVVVLMDGTNEPMVAEYSVLSLGGLDITIDVNTLAGGTTVLTAKSNLAGTALRLRIESIDV